MGTQLNHSTCPKTRQVNGWPLYGREKMTLKDIEESLPNGLHDAQVQRVEIDYEDRTIRFSLVLWTGDLSSDDEATRERYEKGELTIRDFIYCVIEPPDPTYPFVNASLITVGAGSATEEPIKTETPLPQKLPEGAFAYWFFVNEWNSFIHIAAMDASLKLSNN
jgi:hypothetical protein